MLFIQKSYNGQHIIKKLSMKKIIQPSNVQPSYGGYNRSEQNLQPTPPVEQRKKFEIAGTEFVVDARYDVIKQIGSGAYGVVASAIDHNTNIKYAIKKVINAFDDLIDAKRIVRQIKLLKFFKHENIVTITDLLKPVARKGYNDIYIVTQLMETDLHKVIYSKQELSLDHIKYFLFQILKGLSHMHSASVIHRDLKPSNLLLNKDCDLKICDLGLARGYNHQEQEKTQYVVTRWYRAPEVILNASQYTKAIDIWSVGCIVAQLLGRTPLFPGQDFLDQVQRIISILGTPSAEDMKYIGNKDAIKYIKSLPKRTKQKWERLFPNITPDLSDLLTRMLCFNPDKRITAEQCLQHPFFQQYAEQIQQLPRNKETFDWSWDDFEPTKDLLQNIVYEQSLAYHPESKPISIGIKKQNMKDPLKKYKMSKQ